jgi:ribosomal protein S17E
MKKSEHQLQVALAESIQANLNGLSEKHAKKLQKTVASAARRVAKKFAKLLAKEPKHGKQTVASVVRAASKKTVTRAGQHAARPAAPVTKKKASAPKAVAA